MIESVIIIALIVLAIHYTMQEGEIFGKIGTWFYNNLPKKIHPAVFECNVCMTAWYGSALYVLLYGVNWTWPVVVVAAMGVNIVINKWSVDKDSDNERLNEIEQRLNEHGIFK